MLLEMQYNNAMMNYVSLWIGTCRYYKTNLIHMSDLVQNNVKES